MKLSGFFKKPVGVNESLWDIELRADGVHVSRKQTSVEALATDGLNGALKQLEDDGLAQKNGDNYLLDWDSLQIACAITSYDGLVDALSLPPWTELCPRLSSKGALVDQQFAILLGPWLTSDGQQVTPEYLGSLLRFGDRFELMHPQQWELFKAVKAFARRNEAERSENSQRLSWGRIRKLAVGANALMDDFLVKTVVLSPDQLKLEFRKSDGVKDDTVIEIMPNFDDAPSSWLKQFDRFNDVPVRYDLSVENGGIVQLLIAPEVRTVLQQIKKLPGRRIAGSRAQAFLVNPFATLGEDANSVIDEAQFEAAKSHAGLLFEKFTPIIERDHAGFPDDVGICIEGINSFGGTSQRLIFTDADLRRFISRLGHAIASSHQLVFWDGHELEVLPESEGYLDALQSAFEERSKPRVVISYDRIHDLSAYSQRVEGVGVEKPYYSPFIAKKKDDDGWFPGNVAKVVVYTAEGDEDPIAVPVDDRGLTNLSNSLRDAEQSGAKEVTLPWLPKPIALEEARNIIEAFRQVEADLVQGKFEPDNSNKPQRIVRKTLILRSNIDVIDYDEQRAKALSVKDYLPKIPKSFSASERLFDHQRDGVARLQYLYGLQEGFNVRGMLLADDMGLGKTVQLLTLIASNLENDPGSAPSLVVAPVSLLENWREEAERFFPGAFRILTAYGDGLSSLRVPRESIDERLRKEDGLVKFLRPNWIGDAKLVLTTYETLRDLEFSFALQRWSVMVCDEAQRIKNPAAMVTRSAKKQKAGFKIACTGTPVENTLADLWCLFDFIQPGLLGSLNEFGRAYRRPIEIDERDEEGKRRIEELRAKIEPQILRRTKLEVAKDLPKKIVSQECRALKISPQQRNLYAKAIDDFKRRSDPNSFSPFKNHLGLLSYLRLVCTDPRRHGLTVFKPEPVDQYRKASPKLDWLLNKLQEIARRNEKVIIFCEFRNIQCLLQHYISVVLGFDADIINGDTSASEASAVSRQKRIKAFQKRPGFGVIILSPLAVGFGVNIQAANHVVHFTRTWNPAKEDQASDRAWRIGQTKDVYVYYPVVAADDFTTFDVKLDELLERKRSLAGDMLNGCPDITGADFQVQDVVPDDDAVDIDEVVTLDMALRMEWRHFEGLVAAIWSKRGFDTVYCTPSGSDNGVDVVAIKGSYGELIQTKTSASDNRHISWDAVKEVVAGEAFYRRQHAGIAFKKVGMTNQYFNTAAHDKAELNGVELLDQDNLADFLQKTRVTMLDIELFLYSNWPEG